MNTFVRIFRPVCLAMLTALVAACGHQPVPQEQRPRYDADPRELAMGEKYYGPARQALGGDYETDPALVAYVREVGTRLASAAERRLPYEFAILNNSTPIAWALPGGKIAISRGMLYALDSEAELAAVLAHEIAHATVRRSSDDAPASRLLEGGAIALGPVRPPVPYARLYLPDIRPVRALVTKRYSSAAEIDTDQDAMRILARAGYDPRGIVTLEEKLARLGRQSSADDLDAWTVTDPISDERIARARELAGRLGSGGDAGVKRYRDRTARLLRAKPAYDARDEGITALAKGEIPAAQTAAARALAIEPDEPRFHEFQADVDLTLDRKESALSQYQDAIRLQNDYFRPYVQAGVVLVDLGRRDEARPLLERSLALMPTASAYYLLGTFAELEGRTDEALKRYQAASDSDSEVGRLAKTRYARLDVTRHPDLYLTAKVQAATDGTLYALLENTSPSSLYDVRIRLERSEGGEVVEKSPSYTLPSPIPAGKTAMIPMGKASSTDPNELAHFSIVVESVKAVQ
ncbi:MAG: M48 family metalloprotease [Betaproteobacteria bacterium]|nr:M48 family metalloprotease [Betaproteobacteria bacterium]